MTLTSTIKTHLLKVLKARRAYHMCSSTLGHIQPAVLRVRAMPALSGGKWVCDELLRILHSQTLHTKGIGLHDSEKVRSDINNTPRKPTGLQRGHCPRFVDDKQHFGSPPGFRFRLCDHRGTPNAVQISTARCIHGRDNTRRHTRASTDHANTCVRSTGAGECRKHDT
jgi:hypothetical protein